MDIVKYLDFFKEICRIPHVSFHTEDIRNYCEDFAVKHSLRYIKDDGENIVIFKAASAGYENHPAVILQGHLDMVGDKAPESSHDFLKDEIIIDKEQLNDGIITAVDTTLGGDDGIAVAYMLAILADDSLKHPAIEAVFTADEEVGLLGADKLDCSNLSGRYMINIDSEEEGIFLTGCAGGIRCDLELTLKQIKRRGLKIRLEISGLKGGHSGSEIGTQRPSANILMGRLLNELYEENDFGIYSIMGGVVDNAISCQCVADIVLDEEYFDNIFYNAKKTAGHIQNEYRIEENNIRITVTKQSIDEYPVTDNDSTKRLLFVLSQLMQGVIRRNPTNPVQVETSLNLGLISCMEGIFKGGYSIRSSYSTEKYHLVSKLKKLIEYAGGTIKLSGDYPAWLYRPDSELREKINRLYYSMYEKEPSFETIHAGLECGIIAEKMPQLDIISMGPDIYDIHTYKERMSLESCDRVYEFLVKLLEIM